MSLETTVIPMVTCGHFGDITAQFLYGLRQCRHIMEWHSPSILFFGWNALKSTFLNKSILYLAYYHKTLYKCGNDHDLIQNSHPAPVQVLIFQRFNLVICTKHWMSLKNTMIRLKMVPGGHCYDCGDHVTTQFFSSYFDIMVHWGFQKLWPKILLI